MINKKAFTAKVKDQLGWDFPGAFVVIRQAVQTTSLVNTLILNDETNCYDKESEGSSAAIVYTANFWGSAAMQAAGLDSRPLGHFKLVTVDVLDDNDKPVIDDEGRVVTEEVEEWTTLFEANLKHPDSAQVMKGPMTEDDKQLRVIELDVIRNFA